MSAQTKLEPQNPLILRCHRLMEAFAKSDDEREFYLDRMEGFLVYVDLDKSQEELDNLENELKGHPERYCLIPKLTFYETKKIMEGFVNEKVYDIDTKEKLLDIIQSKEARENFVEFIFDHHSEFDKWQQYYQERSRIRIIEWLRANKFQFVFEEDLDLGKNVMEKIKRNLFQAKVPKDILNARKQLYNKAKTYYSNEALNPRPKRGRPPKQVAKTETEPQLTGDIYTTIVPALRPFLFNPDNLNVSAFSFSPRFESEEKMLSRRSHLTEVPTTIESFNQKLASLRQLSSKYVEQEQPQTPSAPKAANNWDDEEDFGLDEDDDWDDEEELPKKVVKKKPVAKSKKAAPAKTPVKKSSAKAPPAKALNGKKLQPAKKAPIPAKKSLKRSK